MGVGIGLFIAMIGLVDAGFVRRIPDAAGTTVPVGLGINGSIASWPTFVFVVGLIMCGILVAKQVRGGLFIGIVLTTVLGMIIEAATGAGPSVVDGKPNPTGWNLAVPTIPSSFGGLPDLSLVGAVDLIGAFSRIGVLSASLLVFTLVLANFFDAMGTMTALGKQAGLVDEDGNLPDMKKALIVEGARTGLANVVTGVLFLLAMFLTPLYEIVPIEAASPVLVIVGALMMAQIKDIDFSQFHIALPAFLTIIIMPFTYSIANGIGVGFITYVLVAVATGRAKTVHWLLWLIAALFLVYFAIDPVMSAVG